LAAPLGIFAIGTARGVDDQEGRALLLERAHGFFSRARKRELGLRHLGARAALDGASFVDVVALLTRRGGSMSCAVRIASRVARGGNGMGGLGREAVYLPSLLRVERSLSGGSWPGASKMAAPIEALMAVGRIAAEAAPLLMLAGAAEQGGDLQSGAWFASGPAQAQPTAGRTTGRAAPRQRKNAIAGASTSR
jgi:hypothetical protein